MGFYRMDGMGASLRSKRGGWVNSPAMLQKQKEKCDEMFTQMGRVDDGMRWG